MYQTILYKAGAIWDELMQMVTAEVVEALSLTGGKNLGTEDAVAKSADQRADILADRPRLLTLWQTVKRRG